MRALTLASSPYNRTCIPVMCKLLKVVHQAHQLPLLNDLVANAQRGSTLYFRNI